MGKGGKEAADPLAVLAQQGGQYPLIELAPSGNDSAVLHIYHIFKPELGQQEEAVGRDPDRGMGESVL